MFCSLGSMTNFKNFHFFSTPSEGGWGKNFNSKFAQNLVFLYLGKVKNFKVKIFPGNRVNTLTEMGQPDGAQFNYLTL